jgi:hypothetical protein
MSENAQNAPNNQEASVDALIAAIEQFRKADAYERMDFNNSEAKSIAVQLRLNPSELMFKLEKMRKEGVKPAELRQAIQEALDEANGAPRTHVRRVTKSETMTPMPSQEEINNALFEKYNTVEKIAEVGSNDPETSLKDVVGRLNEMLQKRENDEKLAKTLATVKPTFKQRCYRVAYVLLRRPVTFMIKFLKALRGDYDNYES